MISAKTRQRLRGIARKIEKARADAIPAARELVNDPVVLHYINDYSYHVQQASIWLLRALSMPYADRARVALERYRWSLTEAYDEHAQIHWLMFDHNDLPKLTNARAVNNAIGQVERAIDELGLFTALTDI